jgi:hypothetical protein
MSGKERVGGKLNDFLHPKRTMRFLQQQQVTTT